jgi:hypothetical protein
MTGKNPALRVSALTTLRRIHLSRAHDSETDCDTRCSAVYGSITAVLDQMGSNLQHEAGCEEQECGLAN